MMIHQRVHLLLQERVIRTRRDAGVKVDKGQDHCFVSLVSSAG